MMHDEWTASEDEQQTYAFLPKALLLLAILFIGVFFAVYEPFFVLPVIWITSIVMTQQLLREKSRPAMKLLLLTAGRLLVIAAALWIFTSGQTAKLRAEKQEWAAAYTAQYLDWTELHQTAKEAEKRDLTETALLADYEAAQQITAHPGFFGSLLHAPRPKNAPVYRELGYQVFEAKLFTWASEGAFLLFIFPLLCSANGLQLPKKKDA